MKLSNLIKKTPWPLYNKTHGHIRTPPPACCDGWGSCCIISPDPSLLAKTWIYGPCPSAEGGVGKRTNPSGTAHIPASHSTSRLSAWSSTIGERYEACDCLIPIKPHPLWTEQSERDTLREVCILSAYEGERGLVCLWFPGHGGSWQEMFSARVRQSWAAD